jgi:phosphopantetheine adenylyltransferase
MLNMQVRFGQDIVARHLELAEEAKHRVDQQLVKGLRDPKQFATELTTVLYNQQQALRHMARQLNVLA